MVILYMKILNKKAKKRMKEEGIFLSQTLVSLLTVSQAPF